MAYVIKKVLTDKKTGKVDNVYYSGLLMVRGCPFAVELLPESHKAEASKFSTKAEAEKTAKELIKRNYEIEEVN